MSLFWSQWMPQFYNQETLTHLRNEWNSNVVRAAMGIESGGYLEYPDATYAQIQTVIEAAIKAIQFFSNISQTYGSYPHIIYEIWNEPNGINWATVQQYANQVIPAIRANDPNNIIVVGTTTWSQDVDIASQSPLSFTNIAYTLHYYAGTHKQPLRDKATVAINNGICIFITEYGTVNADGNGAVDVNETELWWQFDDKNLLSYVNWAIEDKAEGAAALIPGTTAAQVGIPSQWTQSGQLVNQKYQSTDQGLNGGTTAGTTQKITTKTTPGNTTGPTTRTTTRATTGTTTGTNAGTTTRTTIGNTTGQTTKIISGTTPGTTTRITTGTTSGTKTGITTGKTTKATPGTPIGTTPVITKSTQNPRTNSATSMLITTIATQQPITTGITESPVTTQPVLNQCPSGWYRLQTNPKKCLMFLSTRQSFSAANNQCSSLVSSASLVSIDSANENNEILKEASNEINTCDKIFIGLGRNGSSWSWIDGDNQTYNNWDNGYPNADSTQNCAFIEMYNNGKWANTVCTENSCAICQLIRN
uniref:C-type lectin domain-containing protein n=1 Tax=Acrobeloides nanus TaxID=290746 RepID=A0A914DSC8_9BILA